MKIKLQKKESADKMPIILPKPNEVIPAALINPRITLLYGEPKSGKTELCLQLPNSLLLDLEDGSDYAAGTKIKVNNLQELNDIGGEILKAGRPYDYIIVDTATELESWCEADATVMYKNSIVGQNFKGESVLSLPKGSGYHWLRMSYGKWFNALRNLPKKGLIILAHVKDKMIVDKKGREVSSSDLDLTGKLKQITCSKADAIGYLFRKSNGQINNGVVGEDIWVSFNAQDINTGNRPKHLQGEILLSKIVDPRIEKIVVAWDKIFLPDGV